MQKLLIIRFSSLGDITQALAAAEALKLAHPTAQLHWVTRADFSEFLETFAAVDQVWSFNRKTGLTGLFKLALQLRRERYDFVYDAHSNMRSRLISLILFQPGRLLIRRSKERFKRFLLFYCRKNVFKMPYRGALSYLKPLAALIANTEQAPLLRLASANSEVPLTAPRTILLAPSAAWELKKWPTEYWQRLIHLLKKNFSQFEIGLLGGPDDDFAPLLISKEATNFAGRLTWRQTTLAIKNSPLLISGDTGALHIGDGLKIPTLAIIGPTAFGHPSQATSLVLEHDLYCRPCTKDGRGRCYNETFKKCLLEVTPEAVFMKAKQLLETH